LNYSGDKIWLAANRFCRCFPFKHRIFHPTVIPATPTPARENTLASQEIKDDLAAACFPNGVLVDFGSGKGRMLLVASEFGFREERGVEFAHELCETARRNVARYTARTGVAAEFKIIESDAACYAIAADENVFMMYNPFDETILGRVLDNIAASLRKAPRRILIIYVNPRWGRVIEQQADFVLVHEWVLRGFKFAVYSSRDSS